MKESAAIQAVETTLRQTALKGSSRPIAMTAPLGPGGLGLDSLALVEFVVALEKAHRVEVPDDVWGRAAEVTPRYFVEILMQSN